LTLRAGLGWLDTEVDKGTLNGVDLKGNDLISSPDLNFDLSADYDIYLGDTGVVTLHADTSYVDDQYFDIFNTDRIQGEDHWVSNARISFEAANSGYTVAVWVKNIADEVYDLYNVDIQGIGGFDYRHIGAPRTVGAEVTFRF
jgi:iron complex outermembrane receptor protein